MANYWAIAIGINQYHHFQSLMYAQHDALALRNYWVGEAGFAANRCLLLTDTAPAFDETVIHPSRNNIQTYIARLCQHRLQPDDFLWCFFSGYGVQCDGRDYLMPIEGDSTQIPATGISVEALFKTLRTAPTDNILLVLDINRSQGVKAGDRVGSQTAVLAREYGIPTLLSCAPDQFSHETLALRHGLFTAALLEGMRYHGCTTLDHLAHYVSDRVPELSDHHWRPRQDPMAIIPNSKRYQFALPQSTIATVGSTAGALAGGAGLAHSLKNGMMGTGQDGSASSVNANQADHAFILPDGSTLSGIHRNGNSTPSTALVPVPDPTAPPAGTADESEPATTSTASADVPDSLFWRRLLLWGGAIALALLLLVLLRNQAVLFRPTEPESPSPGATNTPQPASPQPDTSPDPTNSLNTNGSGQGGNGAGTNGADGSETSFFNIGTDSNSSDQSDPPSPPPTQGNTQTPSPNPTDGTGTNGTGTVDPNADQTNANTGQNGQTGSQNADAATLNRVRAAIQARQYEQARNILDQVPQSQRNEDYNQLRQQANQGLLNEARGLLNETRKSSRVNQASDFSRAIAKARLIRPGEPLAEQAAQDIERWSQVIWDIAQGRASQGNYNSAIAAARLIPPDRSSIYPTAQTSIAQWQQTKTNQAILQQAQRSIQRYQASSYNQAIAAVRSIQPGQPLYAEAQSFKNQWSAAILNMARYRAKQGRFRDAVHTASLVPQDTPAYADAQAAIAQWQNRH